MSKEAVAKMILKEKKAAQAAISSLKDDSLAWGGVGSRATSLAGLYR